MEINAKTQSTTTKIVELGNNYLVRRALGAEVREGLCELVLAQGGALFHCGDSHERVDQVVRPIQSPR